MSSGTFHGPAGGDSSSLAAHCRTPSVPGLHPWNTSFVSITVTTERKENNLRYHKVLLKGIAVLAENHWHRIRNTDSTVEKCRANSEGTRIQQRGSRPERPSPQTNSTQGSCVELRSTCMSFCLFWNVPMMPLIILAFFSLFIHTWKGKWSTTEEIQPVSHCKEESKGSLETVSGNGFFFSKSWASGFSRGLHHLEPGPNLLQTLPLLWLNVKRWRTE